MKILIVEDNMELATGLVRFLSLKNIQCDMCSDGNEGHSKAALNPYDTIVLDINLPGKDGLEICSSLREKGITTPIIMLTSRSSKTDIITGLDNGADDYLVKPFDYDILVARIEALSRRDLKNKSTTQLLHGSYTLDIQKHSLHYNDTEVHLSTLEFDLFKYFLQNKDRVISRQELYEKVWGEFNSDIMFSKTVDVYIGYLRKKLGSTIIQTKKGAGYIINSPHV